MLDVLAQHCREVAEPGDQEMVEHSARVPMKRSAIALARGAPGRCTSTYIDGGVSGVERDGELGVAIMDEDRKRRPVSSRSMSKLRACWVTQAPVGVR